MVTGSDVGFTLIETDMLPLCQTAVTSVTGDCRYFCQGTLLHHYGEVLAVMMRLRQMCCHPFLVAKAADKIAETIG